MSEYISDFGTKQFLLKNIYWREDDDKKMAWRFNLKTITKEYNNVGVEIPSGLSNTEILFIRGEKSNYVLDEDVALIEKHFTHYSIKTIANSGHWVHAEKPKELLSALKKFMV